MRMPTKKQVEDFVSDCRTHIFDESAVPDWVETVFDHLREWVAEYDEENKTPETP